ncbi:MAG TPA: type IV toxin-antitoxin system AbiEi family antitoxin domain-containing protein [Tepidisphaeraceae bacterium]|jgi:predicted transcriptional regulator of viral defense system|nr:type IV toxin-antitoxin system AbiEi family antitoxin domain-containing protein [Tepidisphaeraceae bacterium]
MSARSFSDPNQQIIRLTRRLGILRPRDLAPLRIPRHHLTSLVEEGVMLRSGRGLYMLADAPVSENHSLAEACKRVPGGVICLLSALRFHGLTTQNPWEVWLALTPASRRPKADHPPLRVVRFSGTAFMEGIERRRIEGVEVRIYSAAKTVADCFKYRNKIGVDVAVQALRDAWQKRAVTADQLAHFARVCRVTNVMRPYLDSLFS